MAIQMTRKEYQSIYGASPVIQSATALDDTPAPVRMTMAEYNEKYGVKEPESGGLLGPAKEAITGLGTLYGGGEQGIAMKLKADIEAGAKDIEQGKVLKGVAKAGLRTAGDIASLIFAPVGAAIQATGFNKLTDYLGEKIAETAPFEAITDIPSVQNFALTHPNAEEDFNRALMLMLAGLDKSKIEPSTIIPRTIRQVGDFGTGVRALPTKLSNMRNARAIERTAEEIANIENNYAATRKANLFTKDAEASRRRIAQTDALVDAVDVEGTIRTRQPGGAVEKYRAATIEGSENIVRESLKKEGAKVNIGEVAKSLTAEVYRSGLEGADLIRAINGLQKELQGLNLRADELGNIDLSKIHDAKISTTQNINYKTDSTPTIKFRKAKARAYKTIVEDKSKVKVTVGEKTYGIPEINKELGKYYEDIERLQALDGKKVKGGRLGKYAAQITGNIAGGAVGGAIGGPIGIGVGTVIGGETASFVRGKTMAQTFGEQAGRAGERNPILEQARLESKLPARVNLKVSDVVVGIPKDIPKTKEILKLERDITKNVEQQKAAIKKGNFALVATLKEIYAVLVQTLKDIVKSFREQKGGYINFGADLSDLTSPGSSKAGKLIGKEKVKNPPLADTSIDAELSQTLRGTKGMTAQDIMKKYPDIQLKRDVPATDIYGNKVKIPEGEALTPYELKGNKILLQDGESYIVSKSQFQNIKGQSIVAEAKEFAPELKGLEESVRGSGVAPQTVEEYFTPGKIVPSYGGGRDKVIAFRPTTQTRGWEVDVAEIKRDGTLGGIRTHATMPDFDKATRPKFSQYQLPGGKNYKEILIKAPMGEPKITVKQSGKNFVGYNENGDLVGQIGGSMAKTKEEALALMQEDVKTRKDLGLPKNATFQSSHYPEDKNLISHLRIKQYDTKKYGDVTFMEEAQSDWMRTLRNEAKEKTKVNGIPNPEKAKEWLRKAFAGEIKTDTPINQSLKDWETPTVKRGLQEAVANDSEYFAWITGEQTSARYNLAKHLKEAKWVGNEFGKKVTLSPTSEKQIIFNIGKDGKIISGSEFGMGGVNVPSNWTGKSLDEVLGKGLADQIMSKESGTLSGEGLKFGGEWANNLYDKQIKNIVEDVTGGKVEVLDMGLPIAESKAQFYLPMKMEAGGTTLRPLTEKNIKVGMTIDRSNAGGAMVDDKYIITDVLGDGKFKAVPKAKWEMVKKDKTEIPDTYKQEFDISSKTTTQQAIFLTPEIKAKIRGEAPKIKTSGKMI